MLKVMHYTVYIVLYVHTVCKEVEINGVEGFSYLSVYICIFPLTAGLSAVLSDEVIKSVPTV